ncbi:MAG: hypothetical protein RBU45_25255 [Myxococcota bacterium]|jgi:hypothetical protein|nr:hypothetical protein [Myxococcota bacterium]
MSVQPIPASIRKHQGDVVWLEENGRAARDEYVSLHDERSQYHARIVFARVMFKNPKTCALYGCAPRWFLEEQAEAFEQFKGDIAKIDPIFKNAWGGGNIWRDELEDRAKDQPTDGAESTQAVTVIETRRGKR